jgi:hypothetical protein
LEQTFKRVAKQTNPEFVAYDLWIKAMKPFWPKGSWGLPRTSRAGSMSERTFKKIAKQLNPEFVAYDLWIKAMKPF